MEKIRHNSDTRKNRISLQNWWESKERAGEEGCQQEHSNMQRSCGPGSAGSSVHVTATYCFMKMSELWARVTRCRLFLKQKEHTRLDKLAKKTNKKKNTGSKNTVENVCDHQIQYIWWNQDWTCCLKCNWCTNNAAFHHKNPTVPQHA